MSAKRVPGTTGLSLGCASSPASPKEMDQAGSVALGASLAAGGPALRRLGQAGGVRRVDLVEDPPGSPSPPQKFALAKSPRQAGSRPGRQRAQVVPSVCVCVM